MSAKDQNETPADFQTDIGLVVCFSKGSLTNRKLDCKRRSDV